jgi:hypothetical protein
VNYGLAAQQLPLALRPTVLTGAARVPVRTAAEYAIIAGFHPAAIGRQGRQAELQQFAHRGCPRRHPVPEAKIVDRRQFFRRKHHLQSFTAHLGHRKHPNWVD